MARSAPVLASAITSTYEEVIFRFNRLNPATGANQLTGLTLSNAEYFIVFRHDEGDAGNNFSLQGASTDQDSTMNQADDTAAVWTASATDDIDITVKSSPVIHTIPGEQFQGINVEVGYSGETGAGVLENEIAFWGTKVFYDTLVGTFQAGELVTFRNETGNALKTGGRILHDDTVDELVVALDSPGAGVIDDNDVIEGITSGATAAINVAGGAIEDEDLGGGEGLVLAKDDNGTTGEVYLQVLTGVNPVNTSRIRSATSPLANYVDATATINTRTVSPEFLGTSTGSNIIGTYGIGFEAVDVGASDRFRSLDDASRVPPNNVVFTVSGLVAGEDRVLVGPRSAGILQKDQLATDVTLSAATETVVQCSTAVPTETPLAGTLRVELDSGIYKRVRYQSNSGNDYTILADDTFVDGDVTVGTDQVNIAAHLFVTSDKVQLSNSGGALPGGLSTATDYWIIKVDANNIQFASTEANAIAGTQIDITSAAGGGTHTIEVQDFEDFSADNATAPANVFLSYIDVLARATTETYTAVHTSNRDLFVRVRDGGATPTKTFESTAAQFLSTAQTVAINRVTDA